MTYLFTKWERSLIFSALKTSCFLKWTLLPNFAFDDVYTWKKIFWWCLNRYYLMILSQCYYKSSLFYLKFAFHAGICHQLFSGNNSCPTLDRTFLSALFTWITQSVLIISLNCLINYLSIITRCLLSPSRSTLIT